MFDIFPVPDVPYIHLYQTPINMRWGEKKLTALCKEAGLDPADGGVFLFFNARRDELKLLFRDATGWQEIQRGVPRGGFLLPAPEAGQAFARIDRRKLTSLFRAG
jgi:hypothetical protein